MVGTQAILKAMEHDPTWILPKNEEKNLVVEIYKLLTKQAAPINGKDD